METLLNKKEKTINNFLGSCTSCGTCVDVCPFLKRYGPPYKIISSNSEVVFECTNCRACSIVCPSEVNPSDALHSLKYKLIKSGKVSRKTMLGLRSSFEFAMKGHRFPFSYYPQEETVFWPGCSLAGTNPSLVKKIKNILSIELNKKVGIALDCCFDPAFQSGDLDHMQIDEIKERLRRHGTIDVITGCTNCYKIFKLYLPEYNVRHILEVLPNTKFFIPENSIFLHHPCPSWIFDDIRKYSRDKIRSVSEEANLPMCCGLGGGVSKLEPELSDEFTKKVISKAQNSTIITYCMGCKGRFLKNNKKAFHILEFLEDARPIERTTSSRRKWLNRFMLSMSLRLNTKKLLTALFLILLIYLTTYLRKEGYISNESLLNFISQYRLLAPILFITLYTIGPSLFIPSLPLTLGAGFLWGPFWGVIFSITGATLGASVPFLLSRYIIGETIKRRLGYSGWHILNEKVKRHGWKAVAFTRIVPVFPYPVLNYLFGITPIPFIHYLWSSFVFMLPACIAYVAFGSSMGELILKGNIKGLIIGILVATVALLLPFAIKPLFRKVFS